MKENNLPPEVNERLAILAEECAEVIHMIGKIQRHGMESTHPDYDNTPNRALLTKEIGHVKFAIAFLIANKDIDSIMPSVYAQSKEDKIKKFLHHKHKFPML